MMPQAPASFGPSIDHNVEWRLSEFGAFLGIGHCLQEGDQIPNDRFLFGEFAGTGDHGRHAGALDSGVNPPVKVDRPPPAAETVEQEVPRLDYRAPAVVTEFRVAADVSVALRALIGLDEKLVAALGGSQ